MLIISFFLHLKPIKLLQASSYLHLNNNIYIIIIQVLLITNDDEQKILSLTEFFLPLMVSSIFLQE